MSNIIQELESWRLSPVSFTVEILIFHTLLAAWQHYSGVLFLATWSGRALTGEQGRKTELWSVQLIKPEDALAGKRSYQQLQSQTNSPSKNLVFNNFWLWISGARNQLLLFCKASSPLNFQIKPPHFLRTIWVALVSKVIKYPPEISPHQLHASGYQCSFKHLKNTVRCLFHWMY